jgi:uncharacterized C2H2 Zn-finger protein
MADLYKKYVGTHTCPGGLRCPHCGTHSKAVKSMIRRIARKLLKRADRAAYEKILGEPAGVD